MPPFSFVLKLSIAGRVASDGGGWNENYSFVLGSGCGRRWRQNIVGRCCRCAGAGALVAAVWFDGILPQLILPEFTLNNICQSHDSQPGRRKKQLRGSTGSVGERCGNIMDQLLFSPADSNSIRPNIVVSLLFVVVKIENSLLTALSSCFCLCVFKNIRSTQEQVQSACLFFLQQAAGALHNSFRNVLPKLRTQRSSSDCLLHQHFKWEKGKQ